MSAITTKKFSHLSAKVFKENVRDENFYLFIGSQKTYSSNNIPRDTLWEENRNFSNVVSAKRINGGDVALVVPRKNWNINTAYDKWSNNNVTLSATNFYVHSNENHAVYLCVNNNSGANSTLTPNTLGTSIQVTDDLYEWKYLYSIDTTSQNRFLDDNWMPVFIDDTVAASSTNLEYGEDPPKDLQSHHVVLTSRLNGAENGDFPIDGADANIYMIGIVSNPIDNTTNTIALAETYSGSDFKINTGDILYVNYLPVSIERSLYQIDNLRIVLEF